VLPNAKLRSGRRGSTTKIKRSTIAMSPATLVCTTHSLIRRPANDHTIGRPLDPHRMWIIQEFDEPQCQVNGGQIEMVSFPPDPVRPKCRPTIISVRPKCDRPRCAPDAPTQMRARRTSFRSVELCGSGQQVSGSETECSDLTLDPTAPGRFPVGFTDRSLFVWEYIPDDAWGPKTSRNLRRHRAFAENQISHCDSMTTGTGSHDWHTPCCDRS